MDKNALDTLFLALDSEGEPLAEGRLVFLNATFHPALKKLKDVHPATDILCQTFSSGRTTDLKQGGYTVCTFLEDVAPQSAKTVLLALPKQAVEARSAIAEGLRIVRPDGALYASASNDAGGQRIAGWLLEAGLKGDSIMKNKARCVVVKGPSHYDERVADEWRQAGAVQALNFGDGLKLRTQPGLFSWDRPDAASRLLVDTLLEKAQVVKRKSGADFGCGIGYLSARLAQTGRLPSRWTLIEDDARSLALAKDNMRNVWASETDYDFIWADLNRPITPSQKFDLVVMNPPFHTGKDQAISLGQAFVRRAHESLVTGGELWLVANVHLPYEKTLQGYFTTFEQVLVEGGFKILKAVRS